MNHRHQHRGASTIETIFGKRYVCDICGQEFESTKRKIANLWVKQRFYQSQGASYTSWIAGIYNTIQTGGIIYLIIGGEKAKGVAIWIFILAWLLQALFETWIGHKDYTKWKLAQTGSTLGSSYTPLQQDWNDRIRKIEKKIAPETFNEKSVI